MRTDDYIKTVTEYIRGYQKSQQQEKLDKYRILNQDVQKGQILFTGSSLMEQFPINELLMTEKLGLIIYNRGIGGFTTRDMLKNMDTQIFDLEPSRIFINIGTNDLAFPDGRFADILERTMENYGRILKQIRERLPGTKVFLMAYYPVNETDKVPAGEWGKTMFVNRNNRNLSAANTAVKELAEKYGCTYIDANDGLTDESGKLKKEYTVEGIHMYANAYRIVLGNLMPWLRE